MSQNRDVRRDFTPALGYAALTGLYDRAVALLTREDRWRSLLLAQLAPQPGETILDIGCGTGSFAILVKASSPECRVVAIDPDPEALRIARRKAEANGTEVEFRQGFADAARSLDGPINKAVSSLVFHQVPVTEKRAILCAMAEVLTDGGELHIADYSRQPSLLMRSLFRVIQTLDGYQNTQANADGVLEEILSEIAQGHVTPRQIVPTPTGAISLYMIRRPATAVSTPPQQPEHPADSHGT